MRFVMHEEYIGVAYKEGGFTGALGGVGPATPPGVLAFASVGYQERYFVLWLYDDEGRTYTRTYPFESIPLENGGPHGIHRIDVTGSLVVVLHDGVVKVFYANYFEGSDPEELWRFNTGWALEP